VSPESGHPARGLPARGNSAPRTAYTARWVLPISSAPVEQGVVVVEGTQIVFAGANDRPARLHGARVVDLGNAALMPGLVNAHTHLELTGMRGMLEGLDFRTWLRTLTAVRRDVFDPESLLDAARQGLAEALRNGITTCADTSDSGTPLQAMHEAGTRGVCYLEVFGPDPAGCRDAVQRLADRARAHRALDTALVRTGLSPHAPYTVSAALFAAVARLAADERFAVAVHIAESAGETAFVRDGTGPFAASLRERGIAVSPAARSPIALLDATGILAGRPLLIHAIHADDEDLRLVRRHGATIVHCPVSNAKLGHGTARLNEMLDAGIAVGLGSDSVASNDRMDMLGEARQAALFAALRCATPDVLPAWRALELATFGGAQALGLGDRIGTLEPGKDADLAAFPLGSPDAGPVFDPAVALVHVLAGTVPASLVTVAGRELLRDGVVLHESDGLRERAAAMDQRLRAWMRANAAG
jgi:cytosine/adenosine deaminase-related metal-dependent hydrolase